MCTNIRGHLSLARLRLEEQPWDPMGGPKRYPMAVWIEFVSLVSSLLGQPLHFRICLCSWKY